MSSDRLTVAEVAAQAGRSTQAVRNWIRKGVFVGGRWVRLAATRLGVQFELSPDALAEFRRLCSPVDPAPVESPTKRAKRAAEGKAETARLLGGRA